MAERIYLYDSTLRDGAQAQGIDFTVADKQAIAAALDAFGIDYIEGGWPGANPTDDAFFADRPASKFAKVSAFGMTRRAGRSASNDPGLQDLLAVHTPTVCLVGKAWDWQVETALKVSKAENLKMIGDSLAHMVTSGREAVFDAEHFFDGYKANPVYALDALRAAHEAGANWLVLCDTNGGSLPSEVRKIVAVVHEALPDAKLGIHCHNDTEQAVANSLAAVESGVRQIQGTINGIGERCGNANLIALIPTLMLKMGFDTGISAEKLTQIGKLSRLVDDRLNRAPDRHAAYVGSSAFAHKGGLHVSAMSKDSRSYEHIDPVWVGNARLILVSDKAGRANILSRLQQMGIDVAADDPRIGDLVTAVKAREAQGYAYEDAGASFELMARQTLGFIPRYYDLQSYRALDECRVDADGNHVTLSEATVKVAIKDEVVMTVAEGNGPVNALDAALRKALLPHYPALAAMHLTDYKVRILTPSEATAALTRVMIESSDEMGATWTTVGVSHNVIDASYNALYDAISYHLMKRQNPAA
ncbi:citramalate synthase [Asticcacaulis benevestitus]|uniref:Citramalate synthase n=1 Tax=Asticcacaulis benevestitus DSM 16100 = ATCC BAA-896 TaxID=1121022 RepID=V4P976_9CAUL|nr:citramalate synthase [Asticcacaulis benevestitus]ESQ81805.1 2-isopropylmalate synthase [Asticcacaulis benevestitus DSM 16100 = ATCC BAA-896]